MSPERAGTPPEEPATTPKMSVPASPVAGTPLHEAQSPMSILYAVAQCHATRTSDDDLTNLAWLHERDLLKGILHVFENVASLRYIIKHGLSECNITKHRILFNM